MREQILTVAIKWIWNHCYRKYLKLCFTNKFYLFGIDYSNTISETIMNFSVLSHYTVPHNSMPCHAMSNSSNNKHICGKAEYLQQIGAFMRL